MELLEREELEGLGMYYSERSLLLYELLLEQHGLNATAWSGYQARYRPAHREVLGTERTPGRYMYLYIRMPPGNDDWACSIWNATRKFIELCGGYVWFPDKDTLSELDCDPLPGELRIRLPDKKGNEFYDGRIKYIKKENDVGELKGINIHDVL